MAVRMIIDAHGHIGRLAERQFTLPEMSRYLDACDVGHVLVSNLDAASHHPGAVNLEEGPANDACLRACREDARLVPLYWVRLGQVDSNIRAFGGALDMEAFVGALFSPRLNGFPADDARLAPYLSVLAKLKKVAFFHTSRDELGRPLTVYTLAKRHPRVPFVLCDAGGDMPWAEALDVVGRARRRRGARLSICTGRATTKEVVDAVAAVGAERVLFGSDALYFGPRHADHCQSFLDQLRALLKPAAFAKVTGDNAASLFQLERV
jgi:predicted TIM-barrel fold metal-dependent hydrolase